MMQKFGFQTTRRRDQQQQQQPQLNSFVDMYGRTRIDESTSNSETERLKLEQKNAYYYQMVPQEKGDELRMAGKNSTISGQPRRTCSETVVVGQQQLVSHLHSFVETMAFSRDSCSDTDSGICTDNGSECQQSPKCSTTGSLSPTKLSSVTAGISRDIAQAVGGARGRQPAIAMILPPSNFKLRHQPPTSNLPSSHQNSQSLYTRRGKQPMKVRFADEVLASENHPDAQSIQISIPKSQPQTRLDTESTNHYYSMPPPISNPKSNRRESSPPPLPDYEMAVRRMREIGRQHQRSASLPRRPDHRQNEQQSRRPSFDDYPQVYETPNSNCKNDDNDYINEHQFGFGDRSQSINYRFIAGDQSSSTLPRENRQEKRLSEAKSLENLASADFMSDPKNVYQTRYDSTDSPINKQLTPSKSCENLNQQPAAATAAQKTLTSSISNPVSIKQSQANATRSNSSQSRNRPRFAHCMSSALQKIADNALHKSTTNEQKTPEMPRANTTLPSKADLQSRKPNPVDPVAKAATTTTTTLMRRPNFQTLPVNSFPTSESELARYHNEGEPLVTDRHIESRLLGLDHQGIQLVELRKRDDGPFGFYIATGSFKKKKGIFVSRITVRGLFPLLAVGDQILDVDFQPVKGRSLEEVQHLMSNTDRVILRTLPAIMR